MCRVLSELLGVLRKLHVPHAGGEGRASLAYNSQSNARCATPDVDFARLMVSTPIRLWFATC